MIKICTRCNKKFQIEPGIIKHKEKLCNDCWKKAKTLSHLNRKAPKIIITSTKPSELSTSTNLNFGKHARDAIRERNNEINKLRKQIDRISRENIKLKEIIITSKIKKEPTVIHERKTQL